MAELEDKSSLASLWKKGKDRLKGKDASGSTEAADASPDTTPPDNSTTAGVQSQTRRAQVRSAQIRHRQRKANYQKQLELDAAQYRDLIVRTDHESQILRRENDAIRAALRRAGIDVSQLSVQQPAAKEQVESGLQALSVDNDPSPGQMTTPEMFSDIDVNDLTVTLSMDSTMGTPAFNISSNSSGESFQSFASPQLSTDDGWLLTPNQEQAAINFILSLEHVCWDHFGLGDFPSNSSCANHSDKDPGMGHALMASSYCMAHAPDSIYDERDVLNNISRNPSPDISTLSLNWQAPGVTLAQLRGLASSLNPGDRELTPVQAWFELCERYPPVMLLEGGVLERLKREFRGVVRCVAYGAAMERSAFESVVQRVVKEFIP